MGVAGDEVDGSILQAEGVEEVFKWSPPLASGTDVADVGAAEEAQGEAFALPADGEEVFFKAISPDEFESFPVVYGDMQALAQNFAHLGEDWGGALHASLQYLHGGGVYVEQVVHFVPFDLEGDEDGDDVVGVTDAGNVGGKSVVAIVKPFAAAGGGDAGDVTALPSS